MPAPLFFVDLSLDARDFEATATEPGLPMLDRADVNAEVVAHWLGPFAAEPEFDGDRVRFYVRDEDNARLAEVVCFPTTSYDVQDHLRQDWEEIKTRLRKADPQSASEKSLHRVLSEQAKAIDDTMERGDHKCHLFKWRQANQPWRLVWCWGYQRKDDKPGAGVICNNRNCGALFVQREGERPLCPVCNTVATPRQPASTRRRRFPALAAILLLALLGLGGWMLWNRPELTVTPADWTGPVGSQIEFEVSAKRLFFYVHDVTGQSAMASTSPNVVGIENGVATAKAPGTAKVKFTYRGQAADAKLQVERPPLPDSLRIEPADIDLASGATLPVQVFAEYAEAEDQPVTDIVDMSVADNNVALVYGGTVEGAEPGETTLTVRLQRYPEDPVVEAEAKVAVAAAEFASIDAELAPNPVPLGASPESEIRVTAVDVNDKEHSLTGSPLLSFSIEPPEIAEVTEHRYLVGKSAGSGKLTVTLNESTSVVEFEVQKPAPGEFAVSPSEANLFVHQRMKLDVTSGGDEPIESVSSDPGVVDVGKDHHLIARSAGEAEVTFTQGDRSRSVRVNVVEGDLFGLRIDPDTVRLRTGRRSTIDVLAITVDGDEFEVAPDELEWRRQPLSSHVLVDRDALTLTGLAPTPEPQTLVVALEGFPAEATVIVTQSPLDDELASEFLVYPPIGVADATGVTTEENATRSETDRIVIDGGDDGDNVIVHRTENGVIVTNPSGTIGGRTIRRDARITRIEGQDMTGASTEEIRTYIESHPIDETTTIEYTETTRDGTRVHVTSHGTNFDDSNLKFEVQALDSDAIDVTETGFRAVVQVRVLREGEYRLVNEQGKPLTDWLQLGPNATARITTPRVDRRADDAYRWQIERRIDGKVDQFSIAFNLKE